MNAQATIPATPKKLKSGAWGALAKAAVVVGDVVTITTRTGKSWDARVTHVFWSDGECAICQTEGIDRAANAAPAEAAESAWSTEIEAKAVVERAISQGDVERVQDYLLSGNTSLSITQYLGYRYLPHKARTSDEWARLAADLRTAFLAVDTPRMRSEAAPKALAATAAPKARAPKKARAAAPKKTRKTRKATSNLADLLARKF